MMELMHRAKVRRIDEDAPYYDSGLMKSRSFTLNLLRIIGVNMTRENGAGNSEQGLVYTNGNWAANQNGINDYGIMSAIALAGDTGYGILLGTGTTSPTVSDYVMETLIDQGAGAGELNYGSTVVEIPSVDGTDFVLPVWRSFSNTSGGNITVQEIGLMVHHYYSTSSVLNFMIAHDLLNFTINDGDAATVEYLVKIS